MRETGVLRNNVMIRLFLILFSCTVAYPFTRFHSAHKMKVSTLYSAVLRRNSILEPSTYKESGYRRPLHWALKVGSLNASLNFFEQFGLKVFRHEEFASGCEATCNGPYGGAWSKTMIGDGRDEQSSFCLELTYNYGIYDYFRGNDMRYIAVSASCYKGPKSSIQTSQSGDMFIESPDGYWIQLISDPEPTNAGTFRYISLHVASLKESIDFYTQALGAKNLSTQQDSTMISFGGDVAIELVQLAPNIILERGDSFGRFACETEDGAPMQISEAMSRYKPSKRGAQCVLHGPMKLKPHNEEVIIIQDPDGHELCFVDARGFQNCTARGESKDGKLIDWPYRSKLVDEALAKQAAMLTYKKPVMQLRTPELLSLLAKTSDDLVIEMFAVWCKQCISSKPFFEKVANVLQELKVPLKIVAIDGTLAQGESQNGLESDDLSMMLSWTKIQGFPTLFFFDATNKSFSAYEGEFNEVAIVEWIKQTQKKLNATQLSNLTKVLSTLADMHMIADDVDCDDCSL